MVIVHERPRWLTVSWFWAALFRNSRKRAIEDSIFAAKTSTVPRYSPQAYHHLDPAVWQRGETPRPVPLSPCRVVRLRRSLRGGKEGRGLGGKKKKKKGFWAGFGLPPAARTQLIHPSAQNTSVPCIVTAQHAEYGGGRVQPNEVTHHTPCHLIPSRACKHCVRVAVEAEEGRLLLAQARCKIIPGADQPSQ